MSRVLLYLSNGMKVEGKYDEGDWDGIYDDWMKGGIMGFQNCCVRGKDVVLMVYATQRDENANL